MDSILLFCALLFGIAFLYAAVGNGDASGCLALMALFNIAPAVMKPTALLLNLFVSAASLVQFYRVGHFRWQLFWPLALAALPFSFLGGLLLLDVWMYKKILGVVLLVQLVHICFLRTVPKIKKQQASRPVMITAGGGIGLLSGLIGVGSSLLSPLMLLLRWGAQKEVAAISALFIFVISVGGLTGQWMRGVQVSQYMVLFVALAFTGGLLGAYIGARRFSQPVLQIVLGAVLLLSVYKLLFTGA